MKLKDRVAIVTGGAKGIGWGIVKILVQEGAKVVVADWDEVKGEETAAEMRKAGGDAIFLKTDVSQEEQVKKLIEATLDRYGKIDILVNDAGIGVYKSVLDTSSEDWDRCLDVNLKGQFLCAKYVIPHMQAQGKGAIVNISSVHSFQTAHGTAPYCASKGGITALTRNMAIDYGPTIRINSIAPGWVLTRLIQ